MKVKSILVNNFTNCYIAYDENSKDAVVIDPGFEGNKIAKFVIDNKLVVKAILLTHAHYDHTSGIDELLGFLNYEVKIYMSKLDYEFDQYPFKKELLIGKNLYFFEDGEKIEFGTLNVEIMSAKGHSSGSSCFIIGDNLFSGDAIFKQSIGRTDFIGSSNLEMRNTIRKFKAIDKNYIIYPGHGESTTLDYEKKYNPFF